VELAAECVEDDVQRPARLAALLRQVDARQVADREPTQHDIAELTVFPQMRRTQHVLVLRDDRQDDGRARFDREVRSERHLL